MASSEDDPARLEVVGVHPHRVVWLTALGMLATVGLGLFGAVWLPIPPAPDPLDLPRAGCVTRVDAPACRAIAPVALRDLPSPALLEKWHRYCFVQEARTTAMMAKAGLKAVNVSECRPVLAVQWPSDEMGWLSPADRQWLVGVAAERTWSEAPVPTIEPDGFEHRKLRALARADGVRLRTLTASLWGYAEGKARADWDRKMAATARATNLRAAFRFGLVAWAGLTLTAVTALVAVRKPIRVTVTQHQLTVGATVLSVHDLLSVAVAEDALAVVGRTFHEELRVSLPLADRERLSDAISHALVHRRAPDGDGKQDQNRLARLVGTTKE